MQLFKKLFIDPFKEKYYIYSDKHTNGCIRVFWKKNRSGYTTDLQKAGVYYYEDVMNDSVRYPLLTCVTDLVEYKKRRFDTFYIKKKDVEKILGPIKTVCVSV